MYLCSTYGMVNQTLKVISMAVALVGIFLISTMVNVDASHGSSVIACEADGYEAGQDGSFSQELYEQCEEVGGADAYYDAFIEGCMSVEGNTENVCEQATDAD